MSVWSLVIYIASDVCTQKVWGLGDRENIIWDNILLTKKCVQTGLCDVENKSCNLIKKFHRLV
jgi:hypothetical protein